MKKSDPVLNTHQKALQINIDNAKYGTLAEIGAGQEVARWFFRVGGAAGTIAKSISAYDMTFSDSIYGSAKRYVSRHRLETMLDHEYQLLLERLQKKRGKETTFFAFANTAAARSYSRTGDECHGWIGVRFQRQPLTPPCEILIHVRLLDKENLMQQEALGIIGVNMVYGALYHNENPSLFLDGLLDNLTRDRIEVDVVKFSGPDFAHLDNKLINLELVRKNLTQSVIIAPDGEVLQAAEQLYKKSIILERGKFQPVTQINLDMMDAARNQFLSEPQSEGERVIEIMEITMRNLLSSGDIDTEDFLARVNILRNLGKTVMITNYAEFHRLGAFLYRYSRKNIRIVLGVALLNEIFKDKYYEDLEGGILESFGRLFKHNSKLYVYPALSEMDGSLITAQNLRVPGHLINLYKHLYENEYIVEIDGDQPKSVTFSSDEVCKKIRSKDNSWEQLVSPEVAGMIKSYKYFGYSG